VRRACRRRRCQAHQPAVPRLRPHCSSQPREPSGVLLRVLWPPGARRPQRGREHPRPSANALAHPRIGGKQAQPACCPRKTPPTAPREPTTGTRQCGLNPNGNPTALSRGRRSSRHRQGAPRSSRWLSRPAGARVPRTGLPGRARAGHGRGRARSCRGMLGASLTPRSSAWDACERCRTLAARRQVGASREPLLNGRKPASRSARAVHRGVLPPPRSARGWAHAFRRHGAGHATAT
jgi:hypothetical protein